MTGRAAGGPFKRLVCALDAFRDEDERLAHLLRAALPLMTTGGTIEVCYVLSARDSSIPRRLFEKWADDYRAEAETTLAAKVARVAPNLPNAERVAYSTTVLVDRDAEPGGSATVLSRHAALQRADLVAVHTHGRVGIERLLLGSFAEALLTRARRPLLLLNPSVTVPERYETAFLPTSLSSRAREGLQLAAEVAQATAAKLIVYHRWSEPPAWAASGAHGDELRAAEATEVDERRETLAAWTEPLRKRGLACEARLEKAVDGLEADHLCEAAVQAGADLLFLFPEDRASKTRELLRNAPVPVIARHLGLEAP